jgi:hypothetical protein
VAWTAKTGGTRSSMAFAEWPRVKLVKVDDVGGADMVTKSGIREGNGVRPGPSNK